MLLAEQPVHQRFVRPGPLVLGSTLLKSPTPTADRDRTVSRRSEPRSRTALMGEQPNPWDLLQPQDATIRHRGAKPPRRWRSYIFSLTIPSLFREPACYGAIDLLVPMRTIHLAMERSVVTGSSLMRRLPRYCPDSSTTSEFTGIAGLSMMFPSFTPDVEVPNPRRCDSWGR